MLGLLGLCLLGCASDPPDASSGTGTGTSTGTDPTTQGQSSTGEDSAVPMGIDCDGPTLAQSRVTWDILQSTHGSTYFLQASRRDSGDFGEPLESGCAYLYTVQVTNGVPTSRTMVPSAFGEQDVTMCEPGWEESGDDLGSNDAPIEPWTMEMHYERCEEAVLSQDPTQNSITFCAFDNGVLAHCSYFPLDCADGCSMGPEGYEDGIDLSNFGFGQG